MEETFRRNDKKRKSPCELIQQANTKFKFQEENLQSNVWN